MMTAMLVLAACGGEPQFVVTATSESSATPEASAPAAPVQGEDWWGWNTASNDPPPLLPEWPWHDNTGLWKTEDREALILHEGDFTTSRAGQVIEGMNITGELIVNHLNVVVKRSWLHGRVTNNTDSPVRIIHCDLGDGRVGDYSENAIKGVAHVYRSNFFGVTDGVQTTPSRGEFIFQDNFLHDFRYSHNPRTPMGNQHNDGFKADSKLEHSVVIRHNTFWSWTMNNMTEQETATRSSGPNWTDNGDPISSTGNMARDGTPENGLQNAGVMIAEEAVKARVVIDGNLFRGHTWSHINVQAGHVELKNNLFSTDENVARRMVVAGYRDIDVWENNVDHKTGKPLNPGD